MVHGEQRSRFDLAFTTPACCADDLRAGRADVGIIPSIEYQRIDALRVLPGLSIASKHRVRSVLLLSRVPLEEIRSVAVDTSSRTSATLVSVLLRKFYGLDPVMRPSTPDPKAMLGWAEAALLIGDPALLYEDSLRRDPDRSLVVFDLAVEWRKFTGLPFVFALWAARPDCAELKGADLRCDFLSSRDQGLAQLDRIAAEWGPRLGLAPEAVRIYLADNIDYTLDEENLAGLRLFYSLAHEVGAIEAVRDLDFI